MSAIIDLYTRLVGKEQSKPKVILDIFLRGLNDLYTQTPIQVQSIEENKLNPALGLEINIYTGKIILGKMKKCS